MHNRQIFTDMYNGLRDRRCARKCNPYGVVQTPFEVSNDILNSVQQSWEKASESFQERIWCPSLKHGRF